MSKRLLVLLVLSASLVMACDVSGLVSQIVPRQQIQDAQATLEAIAPTIAASDNSVPTQASPSSSQAGPTRGFPTSPSTSSSNPFTDALGKAKTASKFRIQFSWLFGGMENGKYAEQPFIDFSGEVDGTKSHMTSKGGFLAMLAQSADTPIEFIDADGQSFMKGVSMFGMTDPKLWYISDTSMSSGFADFAKPDEYKDWVGDVNSNEFKKAASESLDGQTCDVYLYDMKAVQNSGLSALLGMSQDKTDFGVVDKAELRFWLCGDGFVHKFLMDYQGHNATDATQKAAMKMTWHAWDFNNPAIVVTVPKDAKPMPK